MSDAYERTAGTADGQKQNNIDRWGNLTPATMEKGAVQTIEHMKIYRKNPRIVNFETVMTGNVAGMLNTRMRPEEVDIIKNKFSDEQRAELESVIDTIKVKFDKIPDTKGKRGRGDSYWQVESASLPFKSFHDLIGSDDDTRAQIQYKEYVTFVPTDSEPDTIIKEAELFYSSLLEAYDSIRKLAGESGFDIPIKFADSVSVLLNAIDSAVVYVQSPEQGQLVQAEITRVMVKHSVVLGARRGRPKSGFDMMIGKENFSYREILAKLIAKYMAKIFEKGEKLENLAPAQLSKKIIDWAEQLRQLTPEQIVSIIRKGHY